MLYKNRENGILIEAEINGYHDGKLDSKWVKKLIDDGWLTTFNNSLKVLRGDYKGECIMYNDYIAYDESDGNVLGIPVEHFDSFYEKVIPPLESDIINSPNHYTQGEFEVIDEMLIMFGAEKTIAFCQLNSWKYRARAPFKGKQEEDMMKSDKYLEMAYQIQKGNMPYKRRVNLLKHEDE